MCVSPVILPDIGPVACHQCWQCIENRINDFVGRCIAESKVADWSRAITLTYGRVDGESDHVRAAILTYSDVQKWFKLLRRHGHSVRYLVTGEFGSKKHRTHWHVVLFGRGEAPLHKLQDSYFEGAYWCHGFSYWEKVHRKSVAYNCKYVQKGQGDARRQGHIAMSKKPPLGYGYFMDLAEQYVRQGIAPQDFFYRFADVRDSRTGKPELFMLQGRSRELFLSRFVSLWETMRGGEVPRSKVVEEFLDPGSWKGESTSFSRFFRYDLPTCDKPPMEARYSWMTNSSVVWDTIHGYWTAPAPPGREGGWKWLAGLGKWKPIGKDEDGSQGWSF